MTRATSAHARGPLVCSSTLRSLMALVLALGLAVGCGGASPVSDAPGDAALGDTAPGVDGGPDLGVTPDASPGRDGPASDQLAGDAASDLAEGDLALDAPLPEDAPVDQPPPADVTPDTAAPDASPDGSTPTAGPGQCFRGNQCSSGECSEGAPGGICLGCGDPDLDCADTFDECAPGGACSRSCLEDADCVSGLACSPGFGVCGLQRCSDSTECLSVHTCRALGAGGGQTYCQRVTCPAGTGCPAGTTCQGAPDSARVCVEDYLTF